MLLRRFMDHVTQQNWTAAVLDFTIVVAGIFVGLQVNSWNDARLERNLETRYLERLHQELENDIAHFEFGQKLVNERRAQIELLYQIIEAPHLAQSNQRAFVEAIEKAAWKSYLPINRTVYSELVNTGNMILIESEDLREGLSAYYSEIDHWELVIDATGAQQHYVHETAGVLNKDILILIENNDSTWGQPEGFQLDPAQIETVAEDFISRPEAIKWLPRIYQQHTLVSNVLEQHSKRASDLLSEIEQKLQERH
ncbi:MAG: hypothetical protein EP340_06245 [Alphaproteobacteria bacterium]|nr:MAG: hypothetical protein EP340_06245 [Alphaproteobacteria bacterium]